MAISEKRVLEWWEAPGIDGREAFDEEILYLGSLAEELQLPRWALAVRDLMPRWGFEPCAHRFLCGLEQVITMIGLGRAFPRVGACGDVPHAILVELEGWGTALRRWRREGEGGGQLVGALGADRQEACPYSPEKAEAALAVGEAVLALGRGRAALDMALERWNEGARFPLTRRLVDGEEAPLPRLLRHPCCFAVLGHLRRLILGIDRGEVPEFPVCNAALREAPVLDPGRLPALWGITLALAHWLEERPPQGLEARIYALLGPRDAVRHWLVASLYKTLKLWGAHLDRLGGEHHSYYPLL